MDAPAISSPMIDIGVNLTDKAFASDLEAVIARAKAASVGRLILTGTSAAGSTAAAELAASRSGLFSTAGVHPHDAKSFDERAAETLRRLAERPEVVAIGECGLDYNRDFSPRPAQRAAFRAQIELACDLEMPLFVHERDAAGDLRSILDDFGGRLPAVVIHCFTGDGETLASYLERGFYIGITGWICDERRGLHLRELLGEVPSERLMIETDAPYLLPRTIRPRPKSRRNEPAYLPHVASAIAAALSISGDEVARRTTRAAEAFFGLTPLADRQRPGELP